MQQIKVRCIRCGDEYALITGVPRVGEAEVCSGTLNIRPDPVVLELIAHVKEYFNLSCRESGTSQLCGECIGCRMKKILHALPEEYK